MRGDWILVPWRYLQEPLYKRLIGKTMRIYNKADGYLSAEGICTSIACFPGEREIDIGYAQIDISAGLYRDPDHYHMIYMLEEDFNKLDDVLLTNKGQSKCVMCCCKTERKRDFSDMSIREFCPRCKI